MDFLHQMTQFIVEQAFQQNQLTELSEQLKENETKFKSLFESANVGKSITLLTGEVNVNKAFCDMLGYNPDELKTKKWQDLTPLNEISISQKYIDLMLNGEIDSVRFEKRFICKNMSTIWTDLSVKLLKDKNSNPLYFITTIVDITEQKQAEILLRESEEKYRTLISKMMNAFGLHEMIFDEKGEPVDYRFLEINPSWEKTVGIKAESVIGKTIKEIMPTIEESWIQFYGNVVNTGIPAEFEDYNAATNKHYQVYAYCPSANKFAVLFNDISRQKLAEEALRTSEKRFDLAMMIKNEGIWDWNLITNEVYFDPRYYLMAGYEVNEFPHQLVEFTKRVHPDDIDFVMNNAEQHLNGLLDYYRVEFRFRKKNGEYIWIFACGNIVERDKNDNPLRFIGTHQDISELKRMRLIDESRLRLLYFSENHTFLYSISPNRRHHQLCILIIVKH